MAVRVDVHAALGLAMEGGKVGVLVACIDVFSRVFLISNLPNHRSFFRSVKRTSVFDTQMHSSTWSNLTMILKCNADLAE